MHQHTVEGNQDLAEGGHIFNCLWPTMQRSICQLLDAVDACFSYVNLF